LGFKLVGVESTRIEFSFGFSHTTIYFLKENIFAARTSRQKQSFKVFGLDLSATALLVGMLKRLKSPDIYKGKGLRFHREKLKLRKRKKFSR
jgi:ribosomal protein L6P/L9E